MRSKTQLAAAGCQKSAAHSAVWTDEAASGAAVVPFLPYNFIKPNGSSEAVGNVVGTQWLRVSPVCLKHAIWGAETFESEESGVGS